MADYSTGWNMVSLPTVFAHGDYADVFPASAANTLYSYPNNTYQSESVLSNGTGYWVYMDTAATVDFEGDAIASQEVSIVDGWNMIGSVSTAATFSDAGDVTLPGTLYGYDGTYAEVSVIQPGMAYWVAASSDGVIEITAGTPSAASLASLSAVSVEAQNDLSQFHKLRFENGTQHRDLYFGREIEGEFHPLQMSLPPAPPAGSFDARISGGQWISEESKVRVDLQQTDVPLKLSVFGVEAYQIIFMSGNKVLDTAYLESGETTEIPPSADYLMAGPESAFAEELPQEFSLGQNYPNPFNPSTSIRFALPEAADVQLELYNVLGQRVAILLNESRDAGYHTVSFDAGNLSSGIYLYRMTAGSFTQTKKLTLMK